jgi:hypothetical protein
MDFKYGFDFGGKQAEGGLARWGGPVPDCAKSRQRAHGRGMLLINEREAISRGHPRGATSLSDAKKYEHWALGPRRG